MSVLDKPVELTDEAVEKFIQKHKLAVIDIWHPLCLPCRELHHVMVELAKEYEGKCAFGKLNVDKNGTIDPALREKYHLIFGVPTIVVFKNGEVSDYLVNNAALIPSIIRQIIDHNLQTL